MQIDDALARYLRQLEADGRSVHTRFQIARHVRAFARWLREENHSSEVGDLDHETVAGFLASPAARLQADGSPRKASTGNALRSSLRCFLGHVHQAGYAATNAGRLIRRARCSPPPPRGLSDSEREALVAVLAAAQSDVEQRDAALIAVMLQAGLRVGSAVALDVDLERGELRLRRMKGGREDVAVIPGGLAEVLRELVAERTSGPIFRGRHGGRLTTRHVHRRLRYWARRAGIRRALGPHSLRHDFAQRLLDRTGDVTLVQRALNHQAAASTAVYCRCSVSRLREALGAAT